MSEVLVLFMDTMKTPRTRLGMFGEQARNEEWAVIAILDYRAGNRTSVARGLNILGFYYLDPADPAHVVGRTGYGIHFAAVVAQGNLAAVQLHPEKSGPPFRAIGGRSCSKLCAALAADPTIFSKSTPRAEPMPPSSLPWCTMAPIPSEESRNSSMNAGRRFEKPGENDSQVVAARLRQRPCRSGRLAATPPPAAYQPITRNPSPPRTHSQVHLKPSRRDTRGSQPVALPKAAVDARENRISPGRSGPKITPSRFPAS